jgi:hypothetical protein
MDLWDHDDGPPTPKKNPFIRREEARTNTDHGIKAEKKFSKRTGARQTRRSGARENDRGDYKKGCQLIEGKSTVKFSFSVAYDWLVKVCQEARQEQLTPAFTFAFVDREGKPRLDGSWVAIPESEWLRLVNAGLFEDKTS